MTDEEIERIARELKAQPLKGPGIVQPWELSPKRRRNTGERRRDGPSGRRRNRNRRHGTRNDKRPATVCGQRGNLTVAATTARLDASEKTQLGLAD